MTQKTQDKNEAAEERSKDTRRFVREARSATRRKYTAEEKIHIVLEGFRREVTVNELCRREGIKPNNFYSWTKEFMEAGKQRLSRDTTRVTPLVRRSLLSSEKALISNIWWPSYRWISTVLKKRRYRVYTKAAPGPVQLYCPALH